MERFIFNRDYFDKDFMPKEDQIEKLNAISEKVGGSKDAWKSKILRKKDSNAHRTISEQDYNLLKIVDPRLVLDTEKLIGKLLLRVNLDLFPNQKYVLYLMLCLLDEGKKSVGLDDLKIRWNYKKFKQKLTENILNNCMVKINNAGGKKNLYIAKNGKYSIDLSALILFTELE